VYIGPGFITITGSRSNGCHVQLEHDGEAATVSEDGVQLLDSCCLVGCVVHMLIPEKAPI
jgi:hypothetical protein